MPEAMHTSGQAVSVAALIPAAGSGSRLGQGPKALLSLAGKTLLERSVAAFAPYVNRLYVAVSPAMWAQARALLAPEVQLVTGGESRQASVYALLCSSQEDIVIIHDAARPFLAASLIERSIATSAQHAAASVVIPVADSLIRLADGQAVDRQQLRAVQTPQSFRRSLLLQAHQQALQQDYQATDDAALVRALGHDVALIEGSSWLLKVTNPADWDVACALAATWDAQQEQGTR